MSVVRSSCMPPSRRLAGSRPSSCRVLRHLLDDTIVCVENLELVDKHEYMLANKAFHEFLVDLADNETLFYAYRSLSLHELMERVLFSGPTRTAGNSTEEHGRSSPRTRPAISTPHGWRSSPTSRPASESQSQ